MTRAANSDLKVSTLPLWITAASFGPYLLAGMGLRVEHFLIYLLLPVAAVLLLVRRRTILAYAPIWRTLVILLYVTLWTLIVTLFGAQRSPSNAKMLAHLENYVQPIAIILIMTAFVRPDSEEAGRALLKRTCHMLIMMLLLNTAVVIGSVFFDLSSLLGYFTGDPAVEGATVSANAASMGRYSGVFNQPIESGLTYSLGLFAWAYLIRSKSSLSVLDYALASCLLLGGVLSVSKVFILGGIPLCVVYCLSRGGIHRMVNWRLALGGVLAAVAFARILQQWSGLEFFMRLFRLDDHASANLMSAYTAGRFGEEGTLVNRLFARAWEEAPLYGFGFGAETTLDNAYLEYFYQGGLTTVLAYGALLLIIGLIGWQQWRRRREEGRLLLVLFLFVTIGGMGAPVVTINRFSTIFWVFLMLVYAILDCQRRRERGEALEAFPRSSGGAAEGRSWTGRAPTTPAGRVTAHG